MGVGIRYTIEDKGEYLLVVSVGAPASLEAMSEYVGDVYSEVLSRGKEKFMVDESRMFINYDHYKVLTTTPLPPEVMDERLSLRVAVVCAPHSIELYKFFQMAATRNRTYNSRVFDNRRDGEEWLLHGGDAVTLD